MSDHPADPRPSRPRQKLKISILLALAGVFLFLLSLLWRPARPEAEFDRTVKAPPVPRAPIPPTVPTNAPEQTALKNMWREAIRNDGRVLEPGIAAHASYLTSGKSLQLALDEVATLGSRQIFAANRISPKASRGELEKFVATNWQNSGEATYPVLYVKDVPRVPGHMRIVTGEIIASLMPGVTPGEIAREYNLAARHPGASQVGLTRFVAHSAFRALEIVPKLMADARISLVDHDLVKMVAPKDLRPNDPYFRDQWALLPYLRAPLPEDSQTDEWNLNIFQAGYAPELGFNGYNPEDTSDFIWSVWGDFDSLTDGIRGRNVRIGIIDDGLQLDHPDLIAGLADTGQHHAYDMTSAEPSNETPFPPPRVEYRSGTQVAPLKYSNGGHGINVAGLIGARANNSIGTVGVAPESTLIGIRALSYTYLYQGDFVRPPVTNNHYTVFPEVIAPTQDIILAAAFSYLQNQDFGLGVQQKTLFQDTASPITLPFFQDVGQGPAIDIKNNSWGAPDTGVADGPGPEVAGRLENGLLKKGARQMAVEQGRNGLGTIFVTAAGNGRFTAPMDNSNYDGFANARESITVAALARVRTNDNNATGADNNNLHSEWGANVMVSAPGGGAYIGGKGANSRRNDGERVRTPNAANAAEIRTIRAQDMPNGANPVTNLATTDWSINDPERPNDTPYQPALYGRNNGSNATVDYIDKDYTRVISGTSSSAALVSGVVALMLEANPRLSWLDVQNILIRTARNHVSPTSYAEDPTRDPPILRGLDGLDTLDADDVIVIDRDWKKNGAHIWFNHKYGAGIPDATAAVKAARDGILLPLQTEHIILQVNPDSQEREIRDATLSGTTVTPGPIVEIPFNVTALPNFSITHVQVKFDLIEGTFIGDLQIKLISPSNMESMLAEPHLSDSTDKLVNWTFNSLRHWGENGTGTWKLQLRDYIVLDQHIINPRENNSGVQNPKVSLIIHGFEKPLIPEISEPDSDEADDPTIVEIIRGEPFSYIVRADNKPTAWLFNHPLDLLGTVNPFPPGIAPEAVAVSVENHYLNTRRISGTTDAPAESTFDVMVRAANAGGTSAAHYVRFVVVEPGGADSYTAWANYHFPPNASGNPDAMGTADPDLDGANNILEYALGTSPKLADSGSATTFTKEGETQWNFTFNRYPERGCVYELQISSTLLEDSWTTVVTSDPAVNGGVPESTNPGYTVSEGDLIAATAEPASAHRLVTVVNNPEAPPPLYYRVKVTPSRDPLNP